MKKITIFLFSISLLLLLSCNITQETNKENENIQIEYVEGLPENENINLSDNRFKTILPKAGDEINNFQVKHIGKVDSLKANTAHFFHKQSGLNLYYIQTDDKELSFQISFRVPYEDESDAPHVFEHSILSGSNKYKSSNLFFDLNNKTFNTYVNAYTTNGFTGYPVSSMSEEQLLKMVDVYMSCMTAPTLLEDPDKEKIAIKIMAEIKRAYDLLIGERYEEAINNYITMTLYLADYYKIEVPEITDELVSKVDIEKSGDGKLVYKMK